MSLNADLEVLKILQDPNGRPDSLNFVGFDPSTLLRASVDATLESLELTRATFEGPNGELIPELAIGASFEIRDGYVPVIDILKMAFQHCPELVYRAMRETGTTSDLRRIADDVDHDYDMESGQ
jgi:hypothetical protein